MYFNTFESGFNSIVSIFFDFQMLNCCIERKRLSKIRAASVQFSTNVNKSSETRTKSNNSNSENISLGKSSSSAQMESLESQLSFSDDEEFFEAVESQDEANKDGGSNTEDIKNAKRTDNDFSEHNIDNNSSVLRSEGAKEPFGDLKLLVSGEPLLVPITQVGLLLIIVFRMSCFITSGMAGETEILFTV